MSQLSDPPAPFTHPLALWVVLRDRSPGPVPTRREKGRGHWDAAAWQRWGDQPPTHPLVAGGRGGSSFSVTQRRAVQNG